MTWFLTPPVAGGWRSDSARGRAPTPAASTSAPPRRWAGRRCTSASSPPWPSPRSAPVPARVPGHVGAPRADHRCGRHVRGRRARRPPGRVARRPSWPEGPLGSLLSLLGVTLLFFRITVTSGARSGDSTTTPVRTASGRRTSSRRKATAGCPRDLARDLGRRRHVDEIVERADGEHHARAEEQPERLGVAVEHRAELRASATRPPWRRGSRRTSPRRRGGRRPLVDPARRRGDDRAETGSPAAGRAGSGNEVPMAATARTTR